MDLDADADWAPSLAGPLAVAEAVVKVGSLPGQTIGRGKGKGSSITLLTFVTTPAPTVRLPPRDREAHLLQGPPGR